MSAAEAPVLLEAGGYAGKTAAELTEAWGDPATVDLKERDRLMTELIIRERGAATDADRDGLWPSAAIRAREEMAGLYPDPADPRFAARLYEKREFYEARAVAASVAAGDMDACTSSRANAVFELTPVQRIVSRFLSPLTPYQGLLLYHGVGVGKTCSAVTIAEQFLEVAPMTKVIVLVPQLLKDNFKRTVFDPTKLRWSAQPSAANEGAGVWTTEQCTGTSYLERLGLLDNPDLKAVTFKTEEDRRNRYTVTGYQAFANWIARTLAKSVPSGLVDAAARQAAENEILRRLFSDHLIIVDEAHNLRDIGAQAAAVAATEAVAKGEAAENAGGKALNPFLRRIVLNAEGLRLVLMTATPMYNSAPEIVMLLNYLLMNDTKSTSSEIRQADLFTREGDLKPGKAQRALERAARRYVSYMRGENPYTFPLRMRPLAVPPEPAALWPEISATKNPVILTEEDTAAINALPLIFTEPVIGSPVEQALRAATRRGAAAASAGVSESKGGEEEEPEEAGPTVDLGSDAMLDLRMQMANITYPNGQSGTAGWDFYFSTHTVPGVGHKLRVYKPKAFEIDSLFSGEGLRVHAPKIHRIVESIKTARGICFAYSRYIKAGALPLSIALERAGFQRRLSDGRLAPLLQGVPPVQPVCAVCGSRQGAAHAPDHEFRPACYILLTSEDDISPNSPGLVQQATTWPAEDSVIGPLGSNVKVVIGSQVASEGLDLKCVREMHILDSWYHLNRTDQIIGRAIRYCSHSALRATERAQGLPLMSLNNCLIYMHVAIVPGTAAGPALETADMYAYRIAIAKAQMVGRVQRLLKKHAWDCNLELEAITFAGLPPRTQIDAQGNNRTHKNEAGADEPGYDINDQDYTTYCDYQRCRHQCAITLDAADLKIDTSTFSVSDARRIVLAKQEVVRHLFDGAVMVPESVVQDVFGDLPWEIASEALMELLDGRKFRLTRPDGVAGFLVKKAGFLVFQPSMVSDSEIPMALRYARAFQLKRQFMSPHLPVLGRAEERPRNTAATAGPRLVTEAAAATAGAGGGAGATAPIDTTNYSEWASFVAGRSKIPASLASNKLWIFLVNHYAAVPELPVVATRWWFDKVLSDAGRRGVIESVASSSPESPLAEALRQDIYKTSSLIAYRILNTETSTIEYFYRSADSPAFQKAESSVVAVIERQLSSASGMDLRRDGGSLIGFLVPKLGRLIFKTLDTTKEKKHSETGAECAIASNLGEHHPRVRLLHEAGLTTDLGSLMLADSDASWDEAGAKARMATMAPTHMKDITHQPLCLYMEFLCRLLDAKRVGGRRWFLSAIDAFQVGLKQKRSAAATAAAATSSKKK